MRASVDQNGIQSTNNNKHDKLKVMENPLKWLYNNASTHSFLQQQQHNSHNYSNNGAIMAKSMMSQHHGSTTSKKTDAPMLNLVYDSHIKQRYPDFR